MRQNAAQQLADYRGVLGWSSYTDGRGNFRKATEIPLYIREQGIPMRRPQVTEINTATMLDPGSYKDTGVNAIFWGTPEPLQVLITGFIITPTLRVGDTVQWDPKALDASSLNYGNLAYTDIISAYIEGRLNLNVAGVWMRRDPNYFITPQGHKYNDPIIVQYEAQYTTSMRKQQFNMTLFLEK